jgi:hypothetical protein
LDLLVGLEGCAACSARVYPNSAYRNGTLYPVYTAAALSNIFKPAAVVHLTLAAIPASAHSILLRHYRIDRDHSNAYTVWKQMGSPQNPTPEQYAQLEAAGQLQLLGSPAWLRPEKGKELSFTRARPFLWCR